LDLEAAEAEMRQRGEPFPDGYRNANRVFVDLPF
jgi:hypothetical protein